MKRLVWLPSDIKERVKDAIPADLYDKISTEKDVSNVDELKVFLRNKKHPIVENWVVEEEKPATPTYQASSAASTMRQTQTMIPIPQMQGMPMMQIPISGSIALPAGALQSSSTGTDVKLVLKNVKIHVEKLILKKRD